MRLHGMFKRTLIFCVLAFCVLSVRANGDPVAVHSAITLSPTPVAVHVPEVQLVDEYVIFVPDGLYTTVTVRYLLHNRSSRSFDSLPYGFPIDYWGSGPAKWTNLDDYSESEMEVGWRDGYIRNVTFMLGDSQLPWQCSRDTVITPSRKIIADDVLIDVDTVGRNFKHIEDSLFALYGEEIYSYTKAVSRRWYYTYLTIPANGFVTLEVSYKVESAFSEGAYLRKYNVLEFWGDYYWNLRFYYDFTPAAYWGDGHANHFRAMVDASKVNLITDGYWLRGHGGTASGIKGLPMKQQGNLWHYETSRFDLAAAEPFTIDYKLKQPPHQQLDRLLNNRVPSSEYTIEVGGVDKKYPVGNLTDLDPSTATVLRPDKNDSLYITIRFKQPTPLEGMILLNGYTKNADTWRNNSRIDSMMVTGNGYSVHEFGVNEKPDTTYIASDDDLFGKRVRVNDYRYWVTVPDKFPTREPAAYDWKTLIDNATLVSLTNNYGPWSVLYYTELRIYISAITRGLKYNDLCLSELILIKR